MIFFYLGLISLVIHLAIDCHNIVFRSTWNTHIEWLWVEVGTQFVHCWHTLDVSRPLHLWLLHNLFTEMNNNDCAAFQEEWNHHPLTGKKTHGKSPLVSNILKYFSMLPTLQPSRICVSWEKWSMGDLGWMVLMMCTQTHWHDISVCLETQLNSHQGTQVLAICLMNYPVQGTLMKAKATLTKML